MTSRKARASSGKAPAASYESFRNARFGMFIHWGLYSVLGRHEWAMGLERIPLEEYRRLADRFNPRHWDPSAWVDLARKAGMRYMVLTTRHHDGFALFDSRCSDYTAPKSAAGRDLVAEFVRACRKARMGVGLYYSVADWSDTGYHAGPRRDPAGWHRFVRTAHGQLRELMANYGRIDYLFYDGCPPPKTWACARINAEIRRAQPDILISSRCGLDEDIPSAEQHTMGDTGRLWESCMTTNESWGYNWGDPDWKSARQVVTTLITCAHNRGNLLLNIGPRADGAIPQRARRLLEDVGRWLDHNGVAVYGTDPHPFDYHDVHLSTARGHIAYIPLRYYHGPLSTVAGIGNRVRRARLLHDGRAFAFEQQDDRVFLRGLPRRRPDILPVVALELDGKPRGVPNPCWPANTNYQ